jgi:hypothetical protein
MKTKEITLCICEYCNKKYLVRYACERHEKFCLKNPLNAHQCFKHCIHLIKGTEQYTTLDTHSYDCDSDYEVNRVTFQCELTGKFMYSAKAEMRNIVPTYNDFDAIGRTYERMPLECNLYKDQMEVDIEEYL